MAHEKAKVYFDGSHYIAIPHSENPSARKAAAVIKVTKMTKRKKPLKMPTRAQRLKNGKKSLRKS